MEYRRLGSAGIKVSALSLGAWVTYGGQVGEDVAAACMKKAFDAGVNFFDNAEAYASGNAEIVMGNVIRKAGWRRQDLVLSTKIFWGGPGPNDRGLSRKRIVEGTDASLRRLQQEYVDLLFCHRPDPETPIEETVRAMNHVIAQGKALYWGTSEWSVGEVAEAVRVARCEHLIGPSMEQPQYHLLHRERVEREYRPLYDDPGIGLTIWSPLASGLLTGKYDQGLPADTRASLPTLAWLKEELTGPAARPKIERVKRLKRVADDVGCSRAQLAIAWCLKNPHVSTAITGASRVAQLEENLGAMDVLGKLDDGVMREIDDIVR
jgi:voltage-dependent potassium channel beta subunit